MGTEKGKAKSNNRAPDKGRGSRRASSQGDYELTPTTLVELAALVKVVADAGGAVRIGKTRDGGALAVGMYYGDDYSTEYIRPAEDIGEALGDIVAGWLPEQADEYLTAREALYGALSGK